MAREQVKNLPRLRRNMRVSDRMVTDNRIGVAEFTLPPRTAGPPAHWHEVWRSSLYMEVIG